MYFKINDEDGGRVAELLSIDKIPFRVTTIEEEKLKEAIKFNLDNRELRSEFVDNNKNYEDLVELIFNLKKHSVKNQQIAAISIPEYFLEHCMRHVLLDNSELEKQL